MCSLIGRFAALVVGMFLVLAVLPVSLRAETVYTYEFFKWLPQNQGHYDNGQTWDGTWNGHTGTYDLIDVTETFYDFGWVSLGAMTGTTPPAPWREVGIMRYPVSLRITWTEFNWYDPGYYGDPAHYHSEMVIPAVQDNHFAPAHTLYRSNYPTPEPSTLLLLGSGVGGAWFFNRRRRR